MIRSKECIWTSLLACVILLSYTISTNDPHYKFYRVILHDSVLAFITLFFAKESYKILKIYRKGKSKFFNELIKNILFTISFATVLFYTNYNIINSDNFLPSASKFLILTVACTSIVIYNYMINPLLIEFWKILHRKKRSA